MLKEAILGMPDIRCTRCGERIYIDAFVTPYRGELACPNCRNVMDVIVPSMASAEATVVKTKYPNPLEDIGSKTWALLNEIERSSFLDAAICFGGEAYTPCEFMSLRALESVCRRCYEEQRPESERKPWAGILDDLAEDVEFKPYSQGINYFREVRNKLAHPEKTSSKLDADSSYKMALRLTKELMEKFFFSS